MLVLTLLYSGHGVAGETVLTISDATVFVATENTATKVTICSTHTAECGDMKNVSLGMFSIDDVKFLDPGISYLLIFKNGAVEARKIISPAKRDEWDRGVYVIIGAAIGIVSTYLMKIFEIFINSAFRKRRAIMRLRANILEVEGLISSNQIPSYPDVVAELTSYGRVFLKDEIASVLSIFADLNLDTISIQQASNALREIDGKLRVM